METERLESEINSGVFSISVGRAEEAYLPPILDKDPVFAAGFLTIKDSDIALEAMLVAYESIKGKRNLLPLLEYEIMWSKENFEWFAAFTQELIRLLDNSKGYKILYNLKKEIKRKELEFISPLRFNSNTCQLETVEFKIRSTDPISLYRAQYLYEYYEISDFREGLPAWYTMHDTIVFEKYNPKTNKHVRIVFRDGEFHYLMCGASDNWKEIMDVPLEIDEVITAFLFKS